MCNCYGGLVPVAFESCSAYYLYRMVSEEARKQKNIYEAEFTKEFSSLVQSHVSFMGHIPEILVLK